MQVSELFFEDLFTLNCEGNNTIYQFVENETDEDGEILATVIKTIANWWPEGAKGKGQPEQWSFTDRQDCKCNPYADVTKVALTFKNL